ncbi:MAG: hypothetical protein MZV64_30225 [Ignavibacteriales bacterium]|nr:hypothetical protein [Ignavibacteriales bacterium]
MERPRRSGGRGAHARRGDRDLGAAPRGEPDPRAPPGDAALDAAGRGRLRPSTGWATTSASCARRRRRRELAHRPLRPRRRRARARQPPPRRDGARVGAGGRLAVRRGERRRRSPSAARLAGEHGDGRLRAPLVERLYGPVVMALFRGVKEAFDPLSILEPGRYSSRARRRAGRAILKVGSRVPRRFPADIAAALRTIEQHRRAIPLSTADLSFLPASTMKILRQPTVTPSSPGPQFTRAGAPARELEGRRRPTASGWPSSRAGSAT